jgi:hypothetical protein
MSEVLYNILIEFGVHKKLDRIIQMCGKKKRKVHIGIYFS